MTDRQYFFRTFRYLKPYRWPYGIGTFFYCIQHFASSIIFGLFFGGITAAIMDLNFSGVIDTAIMVAVMILVFMLLVGVGAYLYAVTMECARRDLTIDTFKGFMKSSIENQKHSGEGIAAINTDVTTASDIFGNAITPFLQNVLAASFSIVTVLIIDWRMGLGVAAIGLAAFFMQSRFAGPLARLGKARLETNADSVKSLSNIFSGTLTIRAYNRQDRSLFQFDLENGKLLKIAYKQAFIGMFQDLVDTAQGWFTLVITFAFGGWLVAIGEMNFAQIMVIFPLASRISGAMSQIGTNFAQIQPPIVAAKRVFEIIDAGNSITQQSVEGECLHSPTDEYGITINNLSFAYQNAVEDALKNISLKIEENKMVALVGESGSGKSTLLRLIIGMYEREGMGMEIGGLEFTPENIIRWRSQFSYVDQSCKLFDLSIAENIAMGKQGEVLDEEIQAAAKRAFAHDFISELPEGYATSCGEKGASLSGGQKQRLAIARALYRKSHVLVFDEATSALDGESERSLMETIEDLRRDHTILITTHNLNNIINADKIIVMDGGRIAESGTHNELLKKRGIYKKLLESNNEI